MVGASRASTTGSSVPPRSALRRTSSRYTCFTGSVSRTARSRVASRACDHQPTELIALSKLSRSRMLQPRPHPWRSPPDAPAPRRPRAGGADRSCSARRIRSMASSASSGRVVPRARRELPVVRPAVTVLGDEGREPLGGTAPHRHVGEPPEQPVDTARRTRSRTAGVARTSCAIAYRSREYCAERTLPADPIRCVTSPGSPAAAHASASTPATIDDSAVVTMWLWNTRSNGSGIERR